MARLGVALVCVVSCWVWLQGPASAVQWPEVYSSGRAIHAAPEDKKPFLTERIHVVGAAPDKQLTRLISKAGDLVGRRLDENGLVNDSAGTQDGIRSYPRSNLRERIRVWRADCDDCPTGKMIGRRGPIVFDSNHTRDGVGAMGADNHRAILRADVGPQLPNSSLLHNIQGPFGNIGGRTSGPSGPASGNGCPASEYQRDDNRREAKCAQQGLEASPPHRIFRSLSHTPLLTQIGVLTILGFVTTGFVAFGIGRLLNRRWCSGTSLLFLGLSGWAGGVALCVAFTGWPT